MRRKSAFPFCGQRTGRGDGRGRRASPASPRSLFRSPSPLPPRSPRSLTAQGVVFCCFLRQPSPPALVENGDENKGSGGGASASGPLVAVARFSLRLLRCVPLLPVLPRPPPSTRTHTAHCAGQRSALTRAPVFLPSPRLLVAPPLVLSLPSLPPPPLFSLSIPAVPPHVPPQAWRSTQGGRRSWRSA